MKSFKNGRDYLLSYFTHDLGDYPTGSSVGVEVETQFVYEDGRPISVETSQAILRDLLYSNSDPTPWKIETSKNSLVTEIKDSENGTRILYELGRHNIEISFSPFSAYFLNNTENGRLMNPVRFQLNYLYASAAKFGAHPLKQPILETEEDLLVMPDERDATWLKLDGRGPLNLLARTSSVQFTIDVTPGDSWKLINFLTREMPLFLSDYPQDALWKRYIKESPAGYEENRYGNSGVTFESLAHYSEVLSGFKVVSGTRLVAGSEARDFNIPLFIRSVWWHFRLKRYGRKLCLEIRPFARRLDGEIPNQWNRLLSLIQKFEAEKK